MDFSIYSTVATKTKRPFRTMSAQSKLEAVRRVHAGESKASVARSIGVPESTLRGWCKNEPKLLYVSRHYSSGTGEFREQPQRKKIKVGEEQMQPFYFKPIMNGGSVCSPDVALDYSGSGPSSPDQPLDMAAWNTETQASDPERNRTMLARSLELGLNRPQYLSNSEFNASVVDQYRASVMQQQQLSVATSKATTTPADTSNMACSSGGLLTIAYQEKPRYLPREQQSAHDAVWNWLTYQHLYHPQTQLATSPTFNGVSSPMSSVSPTTNGISPTHSSLIWKWYEQAYTEQIQKMSAQDPKAIFSQQQTTDAQPPPQPPAADINAKDVVDNKNRNHKGKALLDNLLAQYNSMKEEPLEDRMTREEAFKVGERFLAWLESCGDPSVSAMQILQFRNLLGKVKGEGDKKNCELRNQRK